MLASIGKQFSEYIFEINRANLSIQLPKIYSSLQINTTEWLKAIDISANVFESIKSLPMWSDVYSKQIASMTESLSLIGKRIAADFAAMNLSALNLSSLGIFDKLAKLLEYNKDSAEAFKSAGWTIAPSMNRELKEKVVVFHQQNKTRYVNQVILGYYHKNHFENLKNAVATWKPTLFFHHACTYSKRH